MKLKEAIVGFLKNNRDSRVFSWGRNVEGQLGVSEISRRFSLNFLDFHWGDSVVDVSCGAFSSAAITKSGTLFMWGENGDIQLGIPESETTTPKKVPLPDPVTFVSCGWAHTAAITTSGSLYLWGSNKQGQLGKPSLYGMLDILPFIHPEISEAKHVACGDHHTVVLLKNGSVFFFGRINSSMANESSHVIEPHILFQPGSGLIGLSAGSNFSLALHEDGYFYSWGRNFYGNLGNGTRSDSLDTPEKVVLDQKNPRARAVFLGTGYYHAFAISQDGSLYTWGQGTERNLGHGDTEDRTKPKKIKNLKFFVPNTERKWKSVVAWLFLGKSDKNSFFSEFPIEVIYHFCSVDF